MAGSLIVIEISAPSVSDDALAVLVSSCTRAARGADCVLAKNAPEETPAAVAIVSLQSDDKMRVEVGVREGDHDTWHTKEFSFLAADDVADRWRAVGFAIGTLAENEPPPAEPAPPAPAPPVEVAPPVPAPLPAPPPRPPLKPPPGPLVFVSALGLFGPGLDRGSWRIGSELGVALAPARLPMYFTFAGSAATRFTRDEYGVTARWFDVSLGVGIPLLGKLDHSGLELSAAFLAERFDASATAPLETTSSASTDSDSRWLFGGQAALGGRVEVAPDLFLTADLRGNGMSGQTVIEVMKMNDAGTAESFRYLASFGLRVRLH